MTPRIERHDSDLGRWTLARWTPPGLAGVVDGLWYFEGTLAHLRERHFPTGRAEIIVHLGPLYRRVEPEETGTFPTVCTSGLLLGPEVIEAPPGPTAVLGIRLHPLGAYRVLGHTLEPLTGITVDLGELPDSDARQLLDRCGAVEGPEARLGAAAAWVAHRVRGGKDADPAVDWMVRALEARHGGVPVGELAEEIGWSRTRLTQTFRRHVGVTPKHFARILRFRRALALVQEPDSPLSGVALDAGYYDQPHFNAEFREMSGVTPSAFREARRFPESPSLAEHGG
jgi:AraC-like DNA-binding protein